MSHRIVAAALLTVALAAASCSSQPAAPSSIAGAAIAPSTAQKGGRAGSIGVVFVTGQGLYYDTFVTKDPLPMEGKFQPLANGQTPYGPGDPEYLGGRWWEDTNGNGLQDAGDHFFLCPLLPPGRPTP